MTTGAVGRVPLVHRFVIRPRALGTLVILGVALSVLGPARITASDRLVVVTDRTLLASDAASATIDHAVTELPRASTVANWFELFGRGQTVFIAALVFAGVVAVADADRVVLAMVGVPWRRRGPPTRRA